MPASSTAPTNANAGLIRRALLLIVLVTFARLIIILITPIELAGDEAQYWDWSRRLDLSYYSKGPGIAWTIAASTSIFGSSEWAIRLPAVIASAITLLAAMWLAIQLRPAARGVAALTTVLALIAIPALHGAALLMTIDSPYIACWALACALAWRCWARLTHNQPAAPTAIALGLALGLAFLYKYTALILPFGFCAFALMRRRDLPRSAAVARTIALIAFTFALCTLPVFIWNAQHDWPTLRHLMGHLGMPAGDLPIKPNAPRDNAFPLWTLEYLAAQLGVIGPILILMAAATIEAVRQRATDTNRWSQNLFLICCGWPVFLFYLFVSFITDIEANWPLAGVITLVILAARSTEQHLRTWRQRVHAWRAQPPPRPRAGLLLARPESPWQIAWHASIAFGVIALIFLAAAPWLGDAPLIGKFIPLSRVSGARELAHAVSMAHYGAHGAANPPIITTHYQTTARLAYYLPNHPAVRCASAFLGDRASSYDHFTDTRLDNPDLLHREVLLVGGSERKWQRSRLQLTNLRMVDETHRIARARFEGLKPPEDPAP